MSIEILKDVKGAEFPPLWAKRLHCLDPEKTYDIEVKSRDEEKATTGKKIGEDFDVTQDPLFLIDGYDIAAPSDSSANIDKDLYENSHPA